MKSKNNKETHLRNKVNRTNMNNNTLFDTEFANEYEFEDRQLQLQVKQNRQTENKYNWNVTITKYSQRTIYSDFWTESDYKHRISENNPRKHTESRGSQ